MSVSEKEKGTASLALSLLYQQSPQASETQADCPIFFCDPHTHKVVFHPPVFMSIFNLRRNTENFENIAKTILCLVDVEKSVH